MVLKKYRMTVDEWFCEWIDVYKSRTVKKGTIETYRALYKAQIAPAIGEVRLRELRTEEIQELMNRQSDIGYSTKTIELTRAVLTGMCKQAVRNRLIPCNPCESLPLPKGRPQEKRVVLSREQQKTLLNYISGQKMGLFIKLALFTGMRGGEISGLQWEDVDLERQIIHVRHTLKGVKGLRCELDLPKTENSKRDIPILPQVSEIFESLGPKKSGYVFLYKGRPIVRGQISAGLNSLQQEMRSAGIALPRFTFHSLRHTFATRCIEAGMKPKTLQKILGHSSISITMDTYVKVLGDELAAEMAMVAASLQ